MASDVQWLLKAGLWLTFLITFIRAYRKKKFNDASARRIWQIFFLWNIAFLLWGEESERLIDAFFNNLPVTLYLKSACMLLAFHLHYLVLKPLKPNARHHRLLTHLAPVVLIVGIVSFVYYSIYEPVSYTHMRFLLVATRDLAMLIIVLLVFIPYTLVMLKRETHKPVKVKQVAALICFVCYSAVALSGISAGVITLVGGTNAGVIASLTNPAVYIAFVAFMVLLMPYRMVSWMFYVERLIIFRRLRLLEETITQVVSIEAPSQLAMRNLLNPDELELAVYRTVISILDNYYLLRSIPRLSNLHDQIQSLVDQNKDYPELVQELARIQVQMDRTEIVPDNSNRIAYWIGRIFHPYFVCIPTVFVVLNDLPWQMAIAWSALVLIVVLGPGIALVALLRYRGRWIYLRQVRGPVYTLVWLSVLFCLLILQLFDAPHVLTACIAALAVWVPLQLLANEYITKISTHAAVLAACITGLLWMGKLASPILQASMLVITGATLWSRYTTKNHTIPQLLLGLVAGSGSVLLTFPLVL